MAVIISLEKGEKAIKVPLAWVTLNIQLGSGRFLSKLKEASEMNTNLVIINSNHSLSHECKKRIGSMHGSSMLQPGNGGRWW